MSVLRVALDATAVLQGRTGIARYVEQLASHLHAHEDVDVRLFALGRGPHPPLPGTHHLPVPLRVVARSWAAGGPPRIERLTGPVDVVHATGLVVPRSSAPLVLSLYDTGPVDHPQLHPARSVRQFRQLLGDLPRVAQVAAISEAAAADVIGHGADPDRVSVVHLGRTALPAPRPVDVEQPFLLAVGEQVPHKDHATLLRAFARAAIPEVALALAGRAAAATPSLHDLATELGVAERVRFLGPVSDAELAWLYEHALVFCHPSMSEGFGMPVLEAMAAGLPVVASDIPTTSEVAPGIALLHPVGDSDACAARLTEVVADAGLRRRLIEAGRQQAARFTWVDTARRTVEVYRRAVGSTAGG
jgi:glycosyltransferase involved in cell wall biosynthesis